MTYGSTAPRNESSTCWSVKPRWRGSWPPPWSCSISSSRAVEPPTAASASSERSSSWSCRAADRAREQRRSARRASSVARTPAPPQLLPAAGGRAPTPGAVDSVRPPRRAVARALPAWPERFAGCSSRLGAGSERERQRETRSQPSGRSPHRFLLPARGWTDRHDSVSTAAQRRTCAAADPDQAERGGARGVPGRPRAIE